MNDHSQKGFTLIILICIIVFVGLMAATAFKFTMLSQQQVNLSLLSAKAKMAAQSALEIAILHYEADPNNCPAQNILFDKEQGALEGFEVKISCEMKGVNQYPDSINDLGIYLCAEAIYKDKRSQKVLINYETGRWVPSPYPS